MDGKVILLFRTTHETLLAEKALTESGVSVKPRIKPRAITSECGMGLEIDGGQIAQAISLCKDKISLPGIFKEYPGKGWVPVKA